MTDQLSEDDLHKAMDDLKDLSESPDVILTASKAVLTYAIETALDRSWDMYDFDKWEWKIVDRPFKTEVHHYQVYAWLKLHEHYIDVERIIFDHDFAKALWGIASADQDLPCRFKWEEHLMRMVIADDPIKYLGENI